MIKDESYHVGRWDEAYRAQVYARQIALKPWGEVVALAITLSTTPPFDYISVVKSRALFRRLTETKLRTEQLDVASFGPSNYDIDRGRCHDRRFLHRRYGIEPS